MINPATPTSSSTSLEAAGIAASARSMRRSSSLSAVASKGEERSGLKGHSAIKLAAAEFSNIRER